MKDQLAPDAMLLLDDVVVFGLNIYLAIHLDNSDIFWQPYCWREGLKSNVYIPPMKDRIRYVSRLSLLCLALSLASTA